MNLKGNPATFLRKYLEDTYYPMSPWLDKFLSEGEAYCDELIDVRKIEDIPIYSRIKINGEEYIRGFHTHKRSQVVIWPITVDKANHMRELHSNTEVELIEEH